MDGYYVTETTTKVYYVEADCADNARMDYSWGDAYYSYQEVEAELAAKNVDEDLEDIETDEDEELEDEEEEATEW
jgi:hypothetical protein